MTEARVSKRQRILSLSSSSVLSGLEEIRVIREAQMAELGALKESRKLGILKSAGCMIKKN